MYKINDMVVYGNEGVCKITDLTKRSFANKVVEYYVLKPVYNEHSIVYIPIDNEELVSKIKRILSVEDIHELIRTLPNEDYCWIENDNQRKEKYREIIKCKDNEDAIECHCYMYRSENHPYPIPENTEDLLTMYSKRR